MKLNIAFVGAGFSSAVLARKLVDAGLCNATIFDSRNHIGGNCHTYREGGGIMIHAYGPHIFHTNRKDIWDYVNLFSEFKNYTNRVKAVTSKGVYSLPINLLTINQFFGKKFNPNEAFSFIKEITDKSLINPQNFEEQALSLIGKDLYEAFFYGYTKKQWGVEPKELPASILKRLPLRFNYDDNYYSHIYQGIPVNGYTSLIEKILDKKGIDIKLSYAFKNDMINDFDHVFYSGAIDKFFNYSEGTLRYRSLKFQEIKCDGDYQGNAVINYCEESIPYTRITEHKHFTPWEQHSHSVCYQEYSFLASKMDELFYPLRLDKDLKVLDRYIQLVSKMKKLTFIGRLGTYRYLDMHTVIGESLDLAQFCSKNHIDIWPSFSVKPLCSHE